MTVEKFAKICRYRKKMDPSQLEVLAAELIACYIFKSSSKSVDFLLNDNWKGFCMYCDKAHVEGAVIKENLKKIAPKK